MINITEEKLQDYVGLVVKHADQGAFTQIYNHFYSRLFASSLYLTKSVELAEEVVSDVFVKIWINRKQLGSIQSLKSYLFVAVRNQSLNYISKNKKYRHCEIHSIIDEKLYTRACPETSMLQSEMHDHIDTAIETLPGRCRQIYKMVRIDGLKHKQVSDILGISVKTIEAQISIALKKLNSRLSPYVLG